MPPCEKEVVSVASFFIPEQMSRFHGMAYISACVSLDFSGMEVRDLGKEGRCQLFGANVFISGMVSGGHEKDQLSFGCLPQGKEEVLVATGHVDNQI